ncbi:MAG TPA: hypothetical protein VGQ83_22675 [Polyangia bacterium]|jgi:hypothetical protein
MLAFLVTSGVRRRLLQLLWGEDARGSAAELAARANAGFASAYRELKAMRRYHLVQTVVEAGREVYFANPDLDAADAEVLRRLAHSRPRMGPPRDQQAVQVRRALRALGAPLQVKPAAAVADVERTLAEGVRLARRDPTVARVLPLCFWRARDRVDPRRLLLAARRVREKQAVGFFLELTAVLMEDPGLLAWAAPFRDGRVHRLRDFFEVPPVPGSRELVDQRTPQVARDWGFRMNMGLDSFRAPLEKVGDVPH